MSDLQQIFKHIWWLSRKMHAYFSPHKNILALVVKLSLKFQIVCFVAYMSTIYFIKPFLGIATIS